MANRFEKAREYTKKFRPHLLPCRFCGSRTISIASDRMMSKDGWFVCCTTKSCDCTATVSSVKEAVKLWNKRQEVS